MADPRERWDDLEEIIHVAVERHLAHVWTAMPVKVTENTQEGHITQLQPTIKGKHTDPKTGATEDVEMPLMGEVPIQYSSGGGFTITHPVKKDDEGIAIFASRCIDGWWDKGGLQPQIEQRRHDLSDAMYVPGIRSKPRKLGGSNQSGGQITIDLRNGQSETGKVSLETLQIRTDKGDVYVEITKDSVNILATEKVTVKCKEMDITASEKLHIETPLVEIIASNKIHIESPLIETNGKITAEGEIHSDQDVTAGGVSLRHHTHGGVQGGLAHTAPPD